MAGLAAMMGTVRPPSLHALRVFWLVVLAVFVVTGATLAVLGPPARLEQRLASGAPGAAAPPPAAATAHGPAAEGPAASGPGTAGPATTGPAGHGPGTASLPTSSPAPGAAPAGTPAAPGVPGAASAVGATVDAPPPAAAERPLPRAEPAMLEVGPYGALPRIGADGRTPMRLYARPFDRSDLRPRIGLVLGGLGMNAALTEEAIRRLPPATTLAFSPYATQITLLLDRARGRGMETLLALPMEPTGYPLNSPGDRALLTGLSASDNADRLDWALSRFTGYVGVIGALGPMRGERYAALGERMTTLQETLLRRGLLYVDPRPGATSLTRAWGLTVDLVVDEPPNRLSIDRKLSVLEGVARERGVALGYAGEATPVLLDRLAAWAGSLESRGSVLAPVSILIRRPEATADRR